jgi:ATP-dependent exoDNAse (exonuclease V) alpha subunit
LKKVTYNDQGDQIQNKYVPPINFYQIILIDEGSMVNDETKELIGYVKEGKALIVLGDYCQLPPVNQETDSYSLKTFLQSLPYQCDFKVRCTIS